MFLGYKNEDVLLTGVRSGTDWSIGLGREPTI